MELSYERFKAYTAGYNVQDGKIALKIKHTYCVVENMMYLADALQIGQELKEMAFYTALYHDIGRFEQVRRYHTFLDAKSVDHADLGVQILRDEAMLPFSNEKNEKILAAIANHNKLRIDQGLDEESLQLAKMIRDADKIDIFRVFDEESFSDVCGKSLEEYSEQKITPAVAQAVKEHRCVNKTERKTQIDIVLTFLGFFYDFNYAISLNKVLEDQHAWHALSQICLQDEENQTLFEKLCTHTFDWAKEQIEKNVEIDLD
jgi:putative nucleotidyltransferase with HDIG domain